MSPASAILSHCHYLSFPELPSDDWSDSDDDETKIEGKQSSGPSDLPTAKLRIKKLEEQLTRAQNDVSELRNLFKKRLDLVEDAPSSVEKDVTKRDDDSHYFQSYGYDG